MVNIDDIRRDHNNLLIEILVTCGLAADKIHAGEVKDNIDNTTIVDGILRNPTLLDKVVNALM